MCGVVGWAFDPRAARTSGLLESLTGALQHRGPDGQGVWRSTDGMAALGHRRLSVIDVSSMGDQPMTSACGRYVIVYNGEIYNHQAIRSRLEAENRAPTGGWRGHSDTETLLEAVRAWGVERALTEMSGMFAFAIWDTERRELTLARDRFGEKPLYVARIGDGLTFASELKAMVAHPQFDRTLEPSALAFFLGHGYVQAPWSIYRSVSKLLPGSYATVGEADLASLGRHGDVLAPLRRFYWRLADVAERGRRDPFVGDEDEALDELENVLGRSVRAQELSDVPLGAFLSGGIDSSLIVALMQVQATTPVRTFTIGFDDEAYDESPYAARVAAHLGTAHTSVVMSPNEALERLHRVPEIWDEPFADVSQLPTLLVAEIARRDVTVALSGDGGDELFGGYERYGWTERMWSTLKGFPVELRHLAGVVLRVLPPAQWDRALQVLPGSARRRLSGDRMHKLADVILARSPQALYDRLMTPWKSTVPLLAERTSMHGHWSGYPTMSTLAETLMYRDAVDYLPDDLMVKVDRAAMSVSLETRAPFLDRDVAAFAWRLPLDMKRRDGTGKWLLRKLLHRHVPAELVDRPKAGFTLPLDAWLRGPLRPWAEELLHSAALEEAGLNAVAIRRAWAAHLAGTEDHRYVLWNVLTFQAWQKRSAT